MHNRIIIIEYRSFRKKKVHIKELKVRRTTVEKSEETVIKPEDEVSKGSSMAEKRESNQKKFHLQSPLRGFSLIDMRQRNHHLLQEISKTVNVGVGESKTTNETKEIQREKL